jgi:hypothetical protein
MSSANNDSLTKKCKTIIRTNSPKDSIEKISKIKNSESNDIIGAKKALLIYSVYKDESVKWEPKKYDNNINSYKSKVENNYKSALNASKYL